jgi:arsenite methyltransferase
MHAEVQQYYGQVLQTTDDLKTTACCTADAPPDFLKQALGRLHEEVLERYYGCGLVLPEALAGATVLDLGCGAGRDAFVLAQLVGEQGRVVGVDMTPEQLDVARRHADFHAEQFGYAESNVEFIEGNIERLAEAGLPDGGFDIIISNCVINLATDKQAVLNDAYRLLKPGGEMYFADIYADRRIPTELQADPVLYGECLSGALYWNDFLEIARRAGFRSPRLVDDRSVVVEDEELASRLGPIRFCSATCRLFKLPELEPTSEDYGQQVRYRGTIEHGSERFVLDQADVFESGQSVPVSGNTASILSLSRFAPHFELIGDRATHVGAFVNDSSAAAPSFCVEQDAASSGCC